MLTTIERKATVQDYERLPEGTPYQLIAGELIMTPSPTPFHQSIILNLAITLAPFVQRNRLGKIFSSPLDVYLGDEDVFQPDLIFIRADRVRNIRKDKLRVIPDLVIEVLSPGNVYYDLTRKKEMYCASGVSEYWIIDPEAESVEVMIKHGNFYQTENLFRKPAFIESPMFPGFQMKVEDLFAF